MQIKTIPTHEKDPQEEKAPRKLLETTSVKMARCIDEHDMEDRTRKVKRTLGASRKTDQTVYRETTKKIPP